MPAPSRNTTCAALMILKDEAGLEGLYPSAIERSDRDPRAQPALQGPPLTRRQRTVRRLAAEAKGDQVELRLVRETARHRWYDFDETELPFQMLQTLASVRRRHSLGNVVPGDPVAPGAAAKTESSRAA